MFFKNTFGAKMQKSDGISQMYLNKFFLETGQISWSQASGQSVSLCPGHGWGWGTNENPRPSKKSAQCRSPCLQPMGRCPGVLWSSPESRGTGKLLAAILFHLHQHFPFSLPTHPAPGQLSRGRRLKPTDSHHRHEITWEQAARQSPLSPQTTSSNWTYVFVAEH